MSYQNRFRVPHNKEESKNKIRQNFNRFSKIEQKTVQKWRHLKSRKLEAMERVGDPNHFYDDDITETISEEFTDRITVIPLIGDIIRFLGGTLRDRKEIGSVELEKIVLDKIKSDTNVSREDIASLVKVLPSAGNNMVAFMNGGPAGENWNKSPCGFYDWIDNRATNFIIGVELGFKADDYGKEVSKKLIEKKRTNPRIYIGILIDGFVSVFLQKPTSERDEFQNNTISMIEDMKKAGIDVKINDSWNPLSSDFLAANHVKLWLFDGQAAFFGGIGIESQFRTTLYDEMDLVRGPFVKILTLIALLLMSNQRNVLSNTNTIRQIHEMPVEQIRKEFLPEIPHHGNITLKLSMNVPGYVQDAQVDYVSLLIGNDVQEIYIMAPYFSDDKVARGLIKAADRLYNSLLKEKTVQIKDVNKSLSDKEIERLVRDDLERDKRIHVIFPKKQENAIIEEVSRYYAYLLRNNPIVETRQFVAQVDGAKFEMLHAKQMIVVLHNDKRSWTKYVKFGGSYNPAGRAHNMWELNAIAYNNGWDESDDLDNNSIKKYLEEVFKVILQKYSEQFPWGNIDTKISVWKKVIMRLAQLLWF